MLKGLFGRQASPSAGEDERAARRDALARIRARTRAILELGPDDVVAANEIACLDPACPGTETVILVMRTGRRTRAAKVAKPMVDVTEQDLAEALVAMDGGEQP